MKITIVTSPTLTEHDDPITVNRLVRTNPGLYETPPLGPLVVASLFRQEGWSVDISNVNAEYCRHLNDGGTQVTFCRDYAVRLAERDSRYYGFSSICSSYPFTLRIAQNLKQFRPDSIIIVGGPQGSATARATLEACPFVDYVLRGEVETSIAQFVKSHFSEPASVAGMCWRDNGRVVSNAPPAPADIDTVPMPAYDLWDMNGVEVIHIEAGRGCPFRCKFCSTSTFFGRTYRLKNPEALAAEAAAATARYGVHKVAFVHDNLFRTENGCREFCETWMRNSDLRNVTWTCSLRVDFVTPAIAQVLARSRCAGVFLGIETGAPRMQRVIGKNINLARARHSISALLGAGVKVTTSFIIGFPEETESELAQTLDFYCEMLRLPEVKPQAGALAVLPDAAYCTGEAMESLVLREGISSMAHQGPPIPNELRQYIASSRDLFASHYSPRLEHLDSGFVSEAEYFLRYATGMYRWLILLIALV